MIIRRILTRTRGNKPEKSALTNPSILTTAQRVIGLLVAGNLISPYQNFGGKRK